MSERREYFRIRIFARVGMRLLAPEEVASVRTLLRQRQPAALLADPMMDEGETPPELRPVINLLEKICTTLESIDCRLESLNQPVRETVSSEKPEEIERVQAELVEITLSGSGCSGPFELDIPPGRFIEMKIDLVDSGLGVIPALARVIGTGVTDGREVTAFAFEEIPFDDQERIVQLAIRNQSQSMRENRTGDLR